MATSNGASRSPPPALALRHGRYSTGCGYTGNPQIVDRALCVRECCYSYLIFSRIGSAAARTRHPGLAARLPTGRVARRGAGRWCSRRRTRWSAPPCATSRISPPIRGAGWSGRCARCSSSSSAAALVSERGGHPAAPAARGGSGGRVSTARPTRPSIPAAYAWAPPLQLRHDADLSPLVWPRPAPRGAVAALRGNGGRWGACSGSGTTTYRLTSRAAGVTSGRSWTGPWWTTRSCGRCWPACGSRSWGRLWQQVPDPGLAGPASPRRFLLRTTPPSALCQELAPPAFLRLALDGGGPHAPAGDGGRGAGGVGAVARPDCALSDGRPRPTRGPPGGPEGRGMTTLTEPLAQLLGPDDRHRARILDAARDAFLEFGIRRTTMGDIGRRCGLSPATLYRRFAGGGTRWSWRSGDAQGAPPDRRRRRRIGSVRTGRYADRGAVDGLQMREDPGRRRCCSACSPPSPKWCCRSSRCRAVRSSSSGAPTWPAASVSWLGATQPPQPDVDADAVAELLARLTLSLALLPESRIPFDDDVALRAFARHHIVPMLGWSLG